MRFVKLYKQLPGSFQKKWGPVFVGHDMRDLLILDPY